MAQARIIAIDGPAGSGKSTLGQKLASCLGYLYFDTGVMYRAVTWAALERGIPLEDAQAVTSLTEVILIDVQPATEQDGREYDVWVDGQDATWGIRLPEIDANVSVVSAYPGVRHALTAIQRRIGMRGNVVMVGRDIGTVVLPEADLKIYLDASLEERAQRRLQQQLHRGEGAELETILDGLRYRDLFDSTREVSPLRAAEDAIVINSDGFTADEILKKVQELVSS